MKAAIITPMYKPSPGSFTKIPSKSSSIINIQINTLMSIGGYKYIYVITDLLEKELRKELGVNYHKVRIVRPCFYAEDDDENFDPMHRYEDNIKKAISLIPAEVNELLILRDNVLIDINDIKLLNNCLFNASLLVNLSANRSNNCQIAYGFNVSENNFIVSDFLRNNDDSTISCIGDITNVYYLKEDALDFLRIFISDLSKQNYDNSGLFTLNRIANKIGFYSIPIMYPENFYKINSLKDTLNVN